MKNTPFQLILFSFVSIMIFCSCKGQNKPIFSTFIWKDRQYLSSDEFQRLDTLGISHLYVRYGDVRWNPFLRKAEPVDAGSEYYTPMTGESVTGVIFITNDVLLNTSMNEIESLGDHVAQMFKSMHENYARNNQLTKDIPWYDKDGEYNNEFHQEKVEEKAKIWLEQNKELLIDCDWTLASRDKYFELLKQLKKQLPEIKITSTLRLWQYRDYQLAGVPPVHKCLLMCYSTGDPSDPKEENAIFDQQRLEQFLTHDEYPTDIDIALPVYSWACLFRNGKFRGIISPITLEEIKEQNNLFELKENQTFIVKCDTVIGNLYYRYGDELKFQGVSADDLKTMALFIKGKISLKPDARIGLFSYSEKNFNTLGNENIQKIFKIFN